MHREGDAGPLQPATHEAPQLDHALYVPVCATLTPLSPPRTPLVLAQRFCLLHRTATDVEEAVNDSFFSLTAASMEETEALC